MGGIFIDSICGLALSRNVFTLKNHVCQPPSTTSFFENTYFIPYFNDSERFALASSIKGVYNDSFIVIRGKGDSAKHDVKFRAATPVTCWLMQIPASSLPESTAILLITFSETSPCMDMVSQSTSKGIMWCRGGWFSLDILQSCEALN